MKTKILTIALAALTIGLLGSCKKEDPIVSVTGVTLDKTTLEITVGDPDVKLTATVAPENATEKSVNWSSDKTNVATVDDQGNVHAVTAGTANITVTTTDGGKTATCVVKVKAAVVPVSSVALDKTELTLTVGDPDVKLVANVTPDNATDKTVNWASDKAEVATVDNQGSVHAVAPGDATITVTTTDGGKTATCVVKVKAAVVQVSSVALDKTELTLTVGDPDVKLVATVTPDNATDKTVNWASDKAEVATVDNQGSVHAVAPGEAIITVTTTDGGKTATCAVKVKAALPANALPGEFSVSTTKKVHFSKGNLYADGSYALHFESNQYSSASSWDASHVSHFTWSSTVEAAVGGSNSGDNLFCDESHKVSVDGGDAIYYALSKDEWIYLCNNHTKGWASVNGKTGYVIAPDGFTGNLESSYADDAALASAGNLVFLPAAGYRDCYHDGSRVILVGDCGYCWSSTAEGYGACAAYFSSSVLYSAGINACVYGYSLRLITESK